MAAAQSFFRRALAPPPTVSESGSNPDGRGSYSTLVNLSAEPSPARRVSGRRKLSLPRWAVMATLILGAVAALVLAMPMIMGAVRGTVSGLAALTASLASSAHHNLLPAQRGGGNEAANSGDDVQSDMMGGTSDEVPWSDALNLTPEDRLYLVRIAKQRRWRQWLGADSVEEREDWIRPSCENLSKQGLKLALRTCRLQKVTRRGYLSL